MRSGQKTENSMMNRQGIFPLKLRNSQHRDYSEKQYLGKRKTSRAAESNWLESEGWKTSSESVIDPKRREKYAIDEAPPESDWHVAYIFQRDINCVKLQARRYYAGRYIYCFFKVRLCCRMIYAFQRIRTSSEPFSKPVAEHDTRHYPSSLLSRLRLTAPYLRSESV